MEGTRGPGGGWRELEVQVEGTRGPGGGCRGLEVKVEGGWD